MCLLLWLSHFTDKLLEFVYQLVVKRSHIPQDTLLYDRLFASPWSGSFVLMICEAGRGLTSTLYAYHRRRYLDRRAPRWGGKLSGRCREGTYCITKTQVCAKWKQPFIDPLPIAVQARLNGFMRQWSMYSIYIYGYNKLYSRIKHSYSIVIAKLFERSVVFSYYSKQLIAAGRQLKSNCILIDFRRSFVMELHWQKNPV
jgi:hypothetical protein